MKLFQLLLISLLMASLSISCTVAQPESAIPDSVKATFKSKYPKAKDISWGKDSNGFYEAKFELNKEKYRADFEVSGKWIETESNIKFKRLPKAVQEAIENKYDKDDIEEIEQVDHYQKGLFYDVEIDEKGEKQIDIEYNALGQIIGTEGKH